MVGFETVVILRRGKGSVPMGRWTRSIVGAVVIGSAVSSIVEAQTPSFETADEIIDYVDRLLRGNSSQGTIVMDIVTENWSRSLAMDVWSLGKEYSLVRVNSPKSEAGTATLKIDNQVWNYLPRADRTIKIPPSLMMGSWMGSHFTNDDLVKESQLIEDYDIEISFDGERDGEPVWEFTMTPKPEAPVVWGRIEQQVRQGDVMPTWAKYYDEDGNLSRVMIFSEFKTMGGRLVPSVMTITPEDKPTESTTIIYSDIEFDVGLDEDFFSLRNLKQQR